MRGLFLFVFSTVYGGCPQGLLNRSLEIVALSGPGDGPARMLRGSSSSVLLLLQDLGRLCGELPSGG